MKIFHGSQSVIKVPQYGLGKVGNDFGLGFYCTESEDLAKEWSVQPNSDGFANAYELDMKGLNVLRLNTPEFTVLNWMAILVSHRQFKLKVPVAGAAYHYLKSRFAVNVDAYDVVIGYRADDSYFDFAEAFLNNSISVEQLAVALRLGKLGEQVVIKSQEALDGSDSQVSQRQPLHSIILGDKHATTPPDANSRSCSRGMTSTASI